MKRRPLMGPRTAAGRAACSAAGRIGAAKSAAVRRAKAKAARTLRVWVDDIETARAIVGDIRPDAASFRALVSKAGGRK